MWNDCRATDMTTMVTGLEVYIKIALKAVLGQVDVFMFLR